MANRTTASKRTSGTRKLIHALDAGIIVTKALARNKFGLANLSARICELRNEGFRIQNTSFRARNGRQVVGYVAGPDYTF